MAQPQSGSTSPPGPTSSSLLVDAPSVRVRRPTRANTLLANVDNPALQSSSGPALADANSPLVRRRRGATITERLFAAPDGYTRVVADERTSSPVGRARSSSRASSGVAVDVVIPGEEAARARRGSLGTEAIAEEEHHHNDEVHVLDVLDQAVSTTAHLTNIQGAFFPNFLSRQPVVELAPATPDEPSTPSDEGEPRTLLSATDDDDDPESDPLDKHLAKCLRRQKRKDWMKETWRGIWAFLKTPIGVLAGIYGLLVVVWGAGLVLLLMIPMNSFYKKLWVEIASQVLTGLFCVTSLLPLPWRLVDLWHISVIYSYARTTYKRRRRLALPPLRDPNDLPDPVDAEYWIGPGGEKMTGPRPAPTRLPAPAKKGKKKGASPADQENDGAVELAQMETKLGSDEASLDETVVLTDKEEERLRSAQAKFARSQSWYRPHTTPTHHAFPINQALFIALFTLGNTIFQIFLCGVMWGLNRFNRPAWTTGCLIPLSFGCGIAAAVLIGVWGQRTKRKAEVTRKVWKMLKKDEEEFEARRKAVAAKRVAEKEEKKHRHAA